MSKNINERKHQGIPTTQTKDHKSKSDQCDEKIAKIKDSKCQFVSDAFDKKVDITFTCIHLIKYFQFIDEKTNAWISVESRSSKKTFHQMMKKELDLKCYNRFELLEDYVLLEAEDEDEEKFFSQVGNSI